MAAGTHTHTKKQQLVVADVFQRTQTVMSNVKDIHLVLCVGFENLASSLPSSLRGCLSKTQKETALHSSSFGTADGTRNAEATCTSFCPPTSAATSPTTDVHSRQEKARVSFHSAALCEIPKRA